MRGGGQGPQVIGCVYRGVREFMIEQNHSRDVPKSAQRWPVAGLERIHEVTLHESPTKGL